MSETKRIGAVIVSHGQVANELLGAAQKVVGELSHITAVSIDWNDDVEMAKAAIAKAIKEVSQGIGVLLLTDMFGGTPTNICAMFLDSDDIEIVTGVNLPMVIKVASFSRDVTLAELAIEVEEQGKEAISRAKPLLVPQKARKDA